MSSSEVRFHVIKVEHSGYFSKMEWDRGRGWPRFSETLDGARIYLAEESYRKDLKRVAQHCPLGGPYPVVEIFTATYMMGIRDDERYQKNKERAAKAEETKRKKWDAIRLKEAQDTIRRAEVALQRAKEEAVRYANG